MNKQEKKVWDTHNWTKGKELPWCKDCGESPISLGFWGDDEWKKTHQKYKIPCFGEKNKYSNAMRSD